MGGGGGGGPFVSRTPQELAKQVRKVEEATAFAAFEAKLSNMLAGLLAGYNGRDVKLVRQRLDDLKDALESSIDGTLDQLFGGSVAKHTYVDGLSDIDSLVIINDTNFEKEQPRNILKRMSNVLRQNTEDVFIVSYGRMAVTVQYTDGMNIQLLPAVRMENGNLRVPSSRTEGWSNINPTKFTEALTRRNQECAGKLIPTIKLAKAINGILPDEQRLSGYHMESLGIAAFRKYSGPKTTAAMLPVYFEKAKSLILNPIRDSTGQSVHVDSYLGPANSQKRINASHLFGRLEKRMRNATVAGSTAQWRALFGLDE